MLRTLLRLDVADRIGKLYAAGVPITAEKRAEFMAARKARPSLASRRAGARAPAPTEPENYAVVGDVAHICIEGVLSEEPDFWAWLFGEDGTTYADIREAFSLAAADPNIKSVALDVASPGGYVDGLFETLAVVEAFDKPVAVQASEACSAAYALAARAGPITAKGPASCFGSIGVACSFEFSANVETIDVTSTHAPDKRPDPRTPEGKAVIVEQLDAIHELFVDAIASGRTAATGKKYTIDKVNEGFGRGATMLAAAAQKAGLIDSMPEQEKRTKSAALAPEPATDTTPSAPVAAQPIKPRVSGRSTQMDLEKLKAEHPELYASIAASGEASGVAKERKRVNALLKLGKSSGAMDVALGAISSGASCLDEEVHADFMSAALNRRETAVKQEESDEAGTALGTVAVVGPAIVAEKDLGDLVADHFDAIRGKKAAVK